MINGRYRSQKRAAYAALGAIFAIAITIAKGEPALAQSPPPPPKGQGVALRLSGFLQADAAFYSQSSEDEVSGAAAEPLNEQRFLIRRARLRGEAGYGIFQGALEVDANTVNGPAARLLAAEVSARWQGPNDGDLPLLMASIGL